jgi:hypothetical protein
MANLKKISIAKLNIKVKVRSFALDGELCGAYWLSKTRRRCRSRHDRTRARAPVLLGLAVDTTHHAIHEIADLSTYCCYQDGILFRKSTGR